MRNLSRGFSLAAAILVSSYAYAGDAKLKAGLVEARTTLVTMIKDPTKRDANQQLTVKKSGNSFSAMLAATTPPADKEAAFKELSETWAAFKQTRETELVPAVLAGKQAEVDKIAGGIQKQRYDKMVGIIDAM